MQLSCFWGGYTVTISIEENLDENSAGEYFTTRHSLFNKVIWDNNNNNKYKQELLQKTPFELEYFLVREGINQGKNL